MTIRTMLSVTGVAALLAGAPLAAQIPAVPPVARDIGVMENDSTRDRGPSVIFCDSARVLTAPADTTITRANRAPVPQCANGMPDSVAGAVSGSSPRVTRPKNLPDSGPPAPVVPRD